LLVHSVLAGIKNINEIENLIEKIIFEGLLKHEESSDLKKEITLVLNTPEIATFFETGYEILAERELLLPEGKILRPDRVIVKNNEAIVIDFKTGKRDKSHASQVKQYSEALQKMNYKSVTGKIVYLSERAVVNV
jgi:ATP-dependent helicase/nuclease subunit A